MMKVSIIIPVYNVEPYIERCLLSALNQTYEDIEIILVDDCGQDKSMEIAAWVIQNHKNGYTTTVLKHQQNKGLSAARNTGINAATGDYVYFLDSDDDLPSNAIRDIVSCFKNSEDIIIGDFKVIGGKRRDLIFPVENMYLQGNNIIFENFVRFKWYEMAWNKLINRTFLFENHLFFEEGILHEDVLWSFLVALRARSAVLCHSMTYNYYIRTNSITASITNRNIDSYIFVLKTIKELAKANHRTKKSFYNYWIIKKYSIISSIFMSTKLTEKQKKIYYYQVKNITNKHICNIRQIIWFFPFSISYLIVRLYKQVFNL